MIRNPVHAAVLRSSCLRPPVGEPSKAAPTLAAASNAEAARWGAGRDAKLVQIEKKGEVASAAG